MPTSYTSPYSFSSTSNAGAAQSRRRSSAHHRHRERNAGPVDERVLRLLEAYRPWEALDGMVLAIIDQTYAALVEVLGLDAPPVGGGAVKASHLFEPPVDDDDPSLSPVLVVVEASAAHCSVRLIDGGPDHHERERLDSPSEPPTIICRPQPVFNRRARVSASPGMIHLARADAAFAATGGCCGGDDGGKGGGDRWKEAVGDVRPDVAEKGLVGVLDAMRSQLDTAIRLEDGVIDMARGAGCRSRIRATDVVRVRMLLGQVRRELDLDAVMRRFRSDRDRIITQMTNRRRPAAEMDVDRVDEADVLMKKSKGLKVLGNNSSETAHGELGNDDDALLRSIESSVTAKLCLD
ncbi:unnamed protein product [Urochloa humidicola]